MEGNLLVCFWSFMVAAHDRLSYCLWRPPQLWRLHNWSQRLECCTVSYFLLSAHVMQISCLTLFQAQVLKLILQAMDHGNAVATAVMHNHKWLIIKSANYGPLAGAISRASLHKLDALCAPMTNGAHHLSLLKAQGERLKWHK